MQKIMFNDTYGLTKAVLNGTKTMTRRVEKGLEIFEIDYEFHYVYSLEIINQYWDEEKNSLAIITPQGKMKVPTRNKLGEVVAMAQAYKDTGLFDIYRGLEDTKGWNNKLFVKPDIMPHQIQITDVRIERLKAISDDDCLKEGIEYSKYERNWFYTNDKNTEFHAPSPRKAFAGLINRPGVGRKGLWESNPFVVVYEFKLVK